MYTINNYIYIYIVRVFSSVHECIIVPLLCTTRFLSVGVVSYNHKIMDRFKIFVVCVCMVYLVRVIVYLCKFYKYIFKYITVFKGGLIRRPVHVGVFVAVLYIGFHVLCVYRSLCTCVSLVYSVYFKIMSGLLVGRVE